MTLPFKEEIINDNPIMTADDFRYCHFIGYLSPTGEIINYSRPFGLGGHNSNPSTDLFMEFMKLQINEPRKYDEFYTKSSFKKYEKADTLDIRRYLERYEIERIREFRAKYGREYDKYAALDDDLYLFFYNCYSNMYFNTGFNGDNFIMSESEFYERVFKPIDKEREMLYPRLSEESDYRYWCKVPPYYQFENQYEWYKQARILEILKDVMTSYLGYHYVARTPRTIYTSDMRIYEIFYNYFLNDFKIIRIPKMIFNPRTKQYEKNTVNEFFVPDSELRLKDEIEAIRKRVPREERSRFYR